MIPRAATSPKDGTTSFASTGGSTRHGGGRLIQVTVEVERYGDIMQFEVDDEH